MNWIRIATKMKNDPRIGTLAARCRVKVPDAVGLVACVLMEFPDHAKDGDVGAVDDLVLEQWALWTGKPGIFADAFREMLCEDSIVRAWEKHNGAALRRAEADIERKRSGRRTDDAQTARERRTNGARQPRGRLQDGGALSAVDETRRTTTAFTAAAANAVVDDRGGEGGEKAAALRAQFVEPHHRDAFDGYRRAHQFPLTMDAEIAVVADGAHGPGGKAVPWPVIGRALHEMRAAGIARFSSSTLAKFIRPLLAETDPDADGAPTFTDLIARAERGELLPHVA